MTLNTTESLVATQTPNSTIEEHITLDSNVDRGTLVPYLHENINQEQYQVMVLIYSVPMVIVMCFSNVVMAVTIYHTKEVIIQKNMFLKSWILVDFLMVLVLMILIGMASDAQHLYQYGHKECTAVIGFTTFPIWLGLFHTILCSYDRYVSVLHSSSYENTFSSKKIYLYVLCGWMISIVFSCVALLWETDISGKYTCSLLILHRGYLILISIVYFGIISVILVYLYTRIYFHVQRHQSQVHVTHTMAQEQLIADSTFAKIMFLNTLLFVSLWLPFNLIALTSLGDFYGRKSWQTALLCSFFIGSIGSTCKFFVFCTLSHSFRMLVLNILTCRHRIHPMTSSGMLT